LKLKLKLKSHRTKKSPIKLKQVNCPFLAPSPESYQLGLCSTAHPSSRSTKPWRSSVVTDILPRKLSIK